MIKPLYDKVLVKRDAPKETTAGGLHLPQDNAQGKPQTGTVVAVGTGRLADDGTLRPLTVKEGEKVMFGKFQGDEIKYDGEDYIIFREADILAVVE